MEAESMSTSTDVPAESSVAAAVPMDVDEQPEASGDAVMSAEKKLEFGDECQRLAPRLLHLITATTASSWS